MLVCSESFQFSLDHKLFIRHAVCSRSRSEKLTVRLCSRSLPLRWSWLERSALFVVELWPCCFSILRRPSLLLLRPGTVELFAVPPVVSVLLLLKRFLDGLNLVFQLGRFQFLCLSSPSYLAPM